MKRAIFILFATLLLSFPAGEASSQIDISAITSLGYTGMDRESEINTMHRGDDPFNPLRISLFMESWVDEDIGVFLEFLWDAGAPPNGMKTKPRVNGAYAVMKLTEEDLANLKFGLIPLPFGSWAPRTYEDRNPLVGIPLFQHYITSLRSNRLALDTDELKNWRDDDEGLLTVAYDACWPWGIEAFGFFSSFEYSLAVTKETMSNPGAYTNDAAQVVGRFGWRPGPGLRLGVSGAYGSYLSKGAEGLPSATDLESVRQKVAGVDVAYAFAHTSFFAEAVRNVWENPNLGDDPGCTSWYLEAKQVLLPGFYAAARLDQMLFDSFTDSAGESFTWDYNITRLEGGLGYFIRRNALVKLVWQHNRIEDNDDVDLLCVKSVFKL